MKANNIVAKKKCIKDVGFSRHHQSYLSNINPAGYVKKTSPDGIRAKTSPVLQIGIDQNMQFSVDLFFMNRNRIIATTDISFVEYKK